jgi:hypothetical protein
MKIIFFSIIGIFIICTALVIYKLISRELKKNSEIQKKIINECKSEEERNIALNKLKRKNIKRELLLR